MTTIITAAAICALVILLYYAQILRERLHLHAATISRLRFQLTHERQRANALKESRDSLRRLRTEDWAVVERMRAHLEASERHRHVIRSRWWRRRAYRSLVVAWRIGRG